MRLLCCCWILGQSRIRYRVIPFIVCFELEVSDHGLSSQGEGSSLLGVFRRFEVPLDSCTHLGPQIVRNT